MILIKYQTFKHFKYIFFLFILTTMLACDMTSEQQQHTPSVQHISIGKNIPYTLSQANQVLPLSNKLVEISGLGIANPRQLYAINDETGYLFLVNQSTGAIESEIDFGKWGDYEGVEAANGLVYIIKSNGTLYEIALDQNTQTTKYETFLKSNNDVEGLAYDMATNQLLLACKGKAGEGDTFKKTKAIYSFDLNKKMLAETPFMSISQTALLDFLNTQKNNTPELNQLQKRLKNFAPSAIAIHPSDKDIYILSSVGKLLVVFHPDKTLKHIHFLDKSVFRQPEGIAFDSENQLFISSEGAGAKAKLLVFSPKGWVYQWNLRFLLRKYSQNSYKTHIFVITTITLTTFVSKK